MAMKDMPDVGGVETGGGAGCGGGIDHAAVPLLLEKRGSAINDDRGSYRLTRRGGRRLSTAHSLSVQGAQV